MPPLARTRTRIVAVLAAAAAVLAGLSAPAVAQAAPAPEYSSFVVTYQGAPFANASLNAYTADDEQRFLAHAFTDASGFASFSGQTELTTARPAILMLSNLIDGNSRTFWWDGARFSTDAAAAQPITIVASGGAALPVALTPATGGIAGTVSAVGGPGVAEFHVDVLSAHEDNWITSVRTVGGAYTVAGLDDGQYRVRFSATPVDTPGFVGYAQMWYPGEASMQAAEAVTVTGGRITGGIDQQLQPVAFVTGTLFDRTDDGQIPTRLQDAAVSFYPDGSSPSSPDAIQSYVYGNGSGEYALTAPPGTYNMAFGSLATGFGTAGFSARQYWYRTGDEASATAITVGPEQRLDGVDAVFAEPVSRVAGFDRFQTSARLSQESFPPGAPVVYITNGLNFPDALSAAPVAYAQDGPVLLVAPEFIPDSVYAEINRLQPERIVILGSTTSVSAGVEETLNELTEGTVTRIAGADRFVTSAKLSASEFEADAPVAYVANGLNFPDALAAAAVAGPSGGPILLVTPTSIPDAVADELDRLNPDQIVVLGGTPSVSANVATQLKGFTTGKVTRFAGSDRFDTSAKISADSFDPGVPVVYVANGLNFPDALAAAAIAGREGGPILLVAPDFIPGSVGAELERLNPDRIVILGGDGNVSPKVAAELAGYLGS